MKDKYEMYVLPNLPDVESYLRMGATEGDIAKHLGVSQSTFRKYKKEHNELSDIIDDNKRLREVEAALCKRAIGYKYTETKTVDKGDRLEITTTEKEMPPDLSAISFLLRNRYPERWSDKPSSNKEDTTGGVVILPEITEDEE